MKFVKLQGRRVCSVCYERTKKPEWREDVVGLVIGYRESGIPPGLSSCFCPKHLKELRAMPVKKLRVVKPKKRKLKRRKHG
jgi:hypothetical protein